MIGQYRKRVQGGYFIVILLSVLSWIGAMFQSWLSFLVVGILVVASNIFFVFVRRRFDELSKEAPVTSSIQFETNGTRRLCIAAFLIVALGGFQLLIVDGGVTAKLCMVTLFLNFFLTMQVTDLFSVLVRHVFSNADTLGT